MGKRTKFKWLAVFALGVVAISGNTLITRADTYTTPPISITASQNNTVTISNEKLASALRTLLGKSATDNFYADDFLNHDNYKATTTTGEGGIETTTAVNYQLDLSNTGVTDITELVQFEFPSTLQGINLAHNGITNEHLTNLSNFLTCNIAGGTITVGSATFEIKSDFSTIIKKVNLNDNNIDLTTIQSNHLQNEKLIFGLQQLGSPHSSGLVLEGEMKPYYYIRDTGTASDEHYFTYTFKYELSTDTDKRISIAYNQVTSLMDNLKTIYGNNTDKISLEVKSIPDSTTAYFKNYNYSTEFIHFSLKLDENFSVERQDMLDMKVSSDGKIQEGSPIILEGFGDNSGIKVSYDNASTSHITNSIYKNYVNITIEKDEQKRVIPMEFKVVDTVKPVIVLIGNAYAYSSQNKEYNDPGVIAYDPATTEDESGDDYTQQVVKTSDLDVTKLGVYTITYTVTDIAGNSTSITRTVEIKERVLDRIVLRTNSQELKDGADIILSVQPEAGIDISNYKDIQYYWYINNTLFQKTLGDSTTGASTITIVGDASANQQIYVKMIATQKADNATIELYSDRLDLILETSLSNNETLILAAAVAVLAIILTITIVALVRYTKGKKRTHYRKNSKKAKQGKAKMDNYNNNADIQVFKDYTGVQGGSNGEGGGNANFRPPENNNNNSMDK